MAPAAVARARGRHRERRPGQAGAAGGCQGHERRAARRQSALAAARGHGPQLGPQLRVQPDPHADRRADAVVQARARYRHRHRREGDVLLRGCAERRAPDPAARDDGRRGARGHRAQFAVRRTEAALVPGPDVPARAAAARALPSVPPDRHRGAGLRGPRGRRRGDRDVPAPVGRSGPARRAPRDQLDRRCARARAPPRRPDRVVRAARSAARRRCAAPPAQQSAAHPRQQESGDAGHARGRATPARLPRRRDPHPLRDGARAPGRPRHRGPGQPATGARHGLLQPAPSSSG